MTTTTDQREVRTIRTFAASRERVFAAWTDPLQLAQWWGPKGFTNTFHRFEPRPEGVWDFTMHGPNGMDFRNTCVFRMIIPNERLVFDHLKEMHFYRAEVDFLDEADGTRIEWIMRFNTAEELDPIRRLIAAANEQNLDKLEAELLPLN